MKKTNRRLFVSTVLLVCAVISVGAQELVLSETEAIERAFKENLFLRAQRVTLATEERQADFAWNIIVPTVSAGGSLSRRNEEIPAPFPAEPYHTTAGYSISAQLAVPPGIVQQVEAVRRNMAAARLSYEDAEENIAEQVRKLFYSLILVQERLGVNRSSVITAEENFRQTRRDYDNGRVDSRTLKQAELRLAEARLVHERTEASMEDSLAIFKSLLGIAEQQEIRLNGTLPEDGTDQSLPPFEAGSRNDIARYEAQIQAQEAMLYAANRSRWLPTVSLTGSYAPSTADPFNPDNDTLHGEWTDSGSLSVGLTFRLDGMLPFSQTSISEDRSAARLSALRLEKQDALDRARREYDSLRRNIERSRTALESRRLNLGIAREVENLTREAYERGTTDFVSLIEAQTDVEEARLALLQEAYNLKSSLIEIEYTAGRGIK